MAYQLGVDLGTSFTAAAICRDGQVEMVSLGTRSLEIPSVVFIETDGSLVVGDAAERRGASDPSRLAREFKRRLGDPAPMLLGGVPFSAEALMAAVLRWVLGQVTEREGGPPSHVTLTRPANWGPYKAELFTQVLSLAGGGQASVLTEPQAAAVHFASTTRVAAGDVVAVYDLGGGTFDAAVLRKTAIGFESLGTPEGIEHLGGADFDEAVFGHVREVIGASLAQLDPEDPAVRSAAARLRRECVEAKEGLSADTEVTISVLMPGLHTEVRLTRAEFEDLIRPSIQSTVGSLGRALQSAGIGAEDAVTVVLAGGSSRIPLIAELVGDQLEVPVAISTHPKHTVALGAAIQAAEDAAGGPAVAAGHSGPPTETPRAPFRTRGSFLHRRSVLAGIAALVAIAVAIALFVILRPDPSPREAAGGTPASVTSAPSTGSATTATSKPGGAFVPTSPFRLGDQIGVEANTAHQFVVEGQQITEAVSAVNVNLTVTAGQAAGSVVAYASETERPEVRSLSFGAFQTAMNATLVQVAPGGKFEVFNDSAAPIQVSVDVTGYYRGGKPSTAGALVPIEPKRLLDAASAQTIQSVAVDVGAPASAVVVSVTVVDPSTGGYVTAFPSGTERPQAAVLLLQPGQDDTNLAIVAVGANGKIDLYTESTSPVRLLVDVLGYLSGDPAGAALASAVGPTRLLDTRFDGSKLPIGPGQTVSVKVETAAGVTGGVPDGVVAVAANIGLKRQSATGQVIAYATGTAPPERSGLTFGKTIWMSNLIVVPVGDDGTISFRNDSEGTVHLVVDLEAYFG